MGGCQFLCLIFCVISTIVLADSTITLPIGYLSSNDKASLKQVLVSALDDSDVTSFENALLGYTALSEQFSATERACNVFKNNLKADDLGKLYSSLSGLKTLGQAKCKVQLPDLGVVLRAKLNGSMLIEDLFYTVSAAKMLNISLDAEKVSNLIKDLRKKNSGVSDLYYTVSAAMQLPLSKPTLESFLPELKATLETADESDNLYLYLENSVHSTALFINTIFNLAASIGKAPAISEEQVVKMANFLHSRRLIRRPRSAAILLSAMKTLSSNKFMVPVVVSGSTEFDAAGASGIRVMPNRQVNLRLTNILGDSALSANVVLSASGLYRHSASSPSAESTLVGPVSRGIFKSTDKGLFVLDLPSKDEIIAHGRYVLELNAKEKKSGELAVLVGINNVRIPLRLLASTKVEAASVSVSKSESSRLSTDLPLTFEKLLVVPSDMSGSNGALLVQHSDHFTLSLKLVDSVTGTPVYPHQVFVQLTHTTTGQSITFICKKDAANGTHSFKLHPDSVASDFDYLSGVYSADLIVGDVLLTNSFVWKFAKIDIHLPANEADLQPTTPDVAQRTVSSFSGSKRSKISSLVGEGPGKAKPELAHTFRTPEPRPSTMLALTFTGLCLAPVALLLISWLVIGVNFWNFPCSFYPLIFHVGLAGIFGLYLLYWFQLNMFVTLRYLAFLGLVTFVAGNRLLRHLVNVRKSSSSKRADK